MRILLVDDDPMNVDLFTAVLEGDGHAVVVATDGVDGHRRALSLQFDLILLDMRLPGMTGDEICRDLRAAGIPGAIVALSASAMPDQIKRGMEAGFDTYLTKPISPAALREAVSAFGAEQK